LRRLRDLGVRVALDDFGTGYASLSFLTRMPLTDIKIDQTFVRGLPDDPKMVSIVRSLIAMAHHLGLKVIAEGVEATPQMQFLLAKSCDEAQGFLFAKPLPAAAFAAFLEPRASHGAAAATA
jgi:EAL domain-containing protein (putative c-di-GMP-specific phosphodiesterase class I)